MGLEPVKIIIADDHSLFREGLRELISRWEDFKVVGEATNGQEALYLARKLLPDIILMDIHMPILDGVAATHLIHQELPNIRVVMLTMSLEEKNLFEGIKAGAQGYLLKDVHARQLHNYLRGVVAGEAPLSGLVAAKVLAEFNDLQNPAKPPARGAGEVETLTEREMQILQMIVDGLSNAEIGERMFLSEQTIKKVVSAIMQKLQLNSRVQVTAYALREGLAK